MAPGRKQRLSRGGETYTFQLSLDGEVQVCCRGCGAAVKPTAWLLHVCPRPGEEPRAGSPNP